MKILEVGCGTGDLLASLKPSWGVGVDFSPKAIKIAREQHPELEFVCCDALEFQNDNPFDVIVMSDVINDIWDVQKLFQQMKKWCHDGTRIIMNYYSNVWQPVLSIVRKIGLAQPILQQNWLTTEDLEGMLLLEGFSTVKSFSEILFPFNLLFISKLLNRYLVKLPLFRCFALTNILIVHPMVFKYYLISRVDKHISLTHMVGNGVLLCNEGL